MTSGVLRMLRKISSGAEPFGFIDKTTRDAATAALAKGDAGVLQLQVRQNGQLTGWAGQYHPETLLPAPGRFYDLQDNSVVLANRDGKRVARYADIHHERRTGYGWYGQWPLKLLTTEYPEWRTRMGR